VKQTQSEGDATLICKETR